jgi:hypothetical protein
LQGSNIVIDSKMNCGRDCEPMLGCQKENMHATFGMTLSVGVIIVCFSFAMCLFYLFVWFVLESNLFFLFS